MICNRRILSIIYLFQVGTICPLAFLTAACGKPAKQNANAMPDYEIQWGTSGGFTGGGGGYTLHPDGRVESWEQIRAGSQRETKLIGNVSSDAILKIRRIIDEKELLRLEHNVAGNMTTSVVFRKDGKEHSISWPAEPGSAPPQIASLMKQLDAMITELK